MISRFDGEYFFLSNFYQCKVVYDGIEYGSAEAAFQAAKTTDYDTRCIFAKLNPSQAKRLGRTIQLRPDWEDIKFKIMKDIVARKFTQNFDLKQKLLYTGNEKLIEGNSWHDYIWGMNFSCTIGENNLGKILMEVRDELKGNKEVAL